MILTLIAEILAGETLVSPGGCVDALTARGDDPRVWGERGRSFEDELAETGAIEVLGSPVAVAVPG